MTNSIALVVHAWYLREKSRIKKGSLIVYLLLLFYFL